MLGTELTVSVPAITRFPPIVMLVAVRLNPAKVTLDPALIVNVEMFTAAIRVGWILTVDTINALSFPDIGCPVSQFSSFSQFVSVVPHHVLNFPAPPKSQLLLLPPSTPLLLSVISFPSRASESCAVTNDTLLLPELSSDQLFPELVDFIRTVFPAVPLEVKIPVTVVVDPLVKSRYLLAVTHRRFVNVLLPLKVELELAAPWKVTVELPALKVPLVKVQDRK